MCALAGRVARLKKSQESYGGEGQASPRNVISYGGSHSRIRRDAWVVAVDWGAGGNDDFQYESKLTVI
jgi:hypothetical protein